MNQIIQHIDIYKAIHKALRFLLFQVSVKIGKYDPSVDSDPSNIRGDFIDLSEFLSEHGKHEDNFFHDALKDTHPAVFETLEQQHQQSERDWQQVEHLAENLFLAKNPLDAKEWHELYLSFNQFLAGYLSHLYFEEKTVLPLIWQVISPDEIMKRLGAMFQVFTPKTVERSKKWCLLACSQTELKEMKYI